MIFKNYLFFNEKIKKILFKFPISVIKKIINN